jgi:hypothetical protein
MYVASGLLSGSIRPVPARSMSTVNQLQLAKGAIALLVLILVCFPFVFNKAQQLQVRSDVAVSS